MKFQLLYSLILTVRVVARHSGFPHDTFDEYLLLRSSYFDQDPQLSARSDRPTPFDSPPEPPEDRYGLRRLRQMGSEGVSRLYSSLRERKQVSPSRQASMSSQGSGVALLRPGSWSSLRPDSWTKKGRQKSKDKEGSSRRKSVELGQLKVEIPSPPPSEAPSKGQKRGKSRLTAAKENIQLAGQAVWHNPAALTTAGASLGAGIASVGAGLGGNPISASGAGMGAGFGMVQAGVEWNKAFQDAKAAKRSKARTKRKRKGSRKDRRSLDNNLQLLLGRGLLSIQDIEDAVLIARAIERKQALQRKRLYEDYLREEKE